MTIDQLTALITAVAADELPIWDADEAKAKKITVQDFINSVVTIADLLKKTDIYNGLDQTAAGYALDARQGKALNDAVSAINTHRNKTVTLGQGDTASVSDIINNGECGVLFVQPSSFALANLGYIALIRRAGSTYYVTSVSFSGTETLRPSLDSSGVLSVTNTTYSGTYRCMFIVI